MAVTWDKLAKENDVVLKSTLTAKGSLITASAASTPAELAIGTDGYILAVSTDTPAWIDPSGLAVAAHATTHKNSGSDELLLHELGEPTSAVAFDGQQATDFVVENSSTAPATPVLGKVYYDTDDNSVYVCTSIA
jgi:hypothetical protein